MHRLLLIDDDEHLGPPLAAYLRRFDFELQAATRPSDGLALLARGGFDAVILDVMSAGVRRRRGLPPYPATGGQRQRHPGADAHRPRRAQRPRRRAGAGRRRLPAQAVRAARAGGPAADHPAAGAAGGVGGGGAGGSAERIVVNRVRQPLAGLRRPADRHRAPRGATRRRGGRADQHRIRAADLAGPRAATGVHPRRDPQPPARPRCRPVHPRGRPAGQSAAPQARATGRHQNPAQRWLHAGAGYTLALARPAG